MATRDGGFDSESLFCTITTGKVVLTCNSSRRVTSGQPCWTRAPAGVQGREGRGVARGSGDARTPAPVPRSQPRPPSLCCREPQAAETQGLGLRGPGCRGGRSPAQVPGRGAESGVGPDWNPSRRPRESPLSQRRARASRGRPTPPRPPGTFVNPVLSGPAGCPPG